MKTRGPLQVNFSPAPGPARARVCMCDVGVGVGVGVGVAVGATGGGCSVGARARTFFAGWALIVGVGRVQDAAHDPVPPQLRH